MEEKIVTVLNEMSEYLSITQMKKLQEVIIKTFAENEATKVDIENEDFLNMFLAAKRIEGCSERTIDYYRVTVQHLLSCTEKSVRKITTVGRTAVVDEDMPTFALQRSVAVLHPKNDVCLPRFLMYALRGKRTYIENRAKGVAQKGIYLKEVSDIDIYIPDISNQEIIINKLDKVNAVIKFRQEELLALDNLIKARFVELFGHQSHNEKSLPYMTIDDVAEIYLGITHTPIYVDSGVMFISAKNTSGDFLDLSDVKYISREEFEGAPKGSKPQVNDVLFSRVGSNLGHPVILEEELELCTFVSLGFLRSKGIVTSNYLKHWMRDEFFAKQVSEHVKGGGQPNLNTGWLKEFKIIVPGLEGQKEFDDFCKQVDKSKVAVLKIF